MSYTTFGYSNLTISKPIMLTTDSVKVSIDVKNTGSRYGDEIVELYIRDEVSSVTRPIKELKDFKRVSLKAGEMKQLTFTITPEKLKFYNMAMQEMIEPGDFAIMVGASSQQYQTVKLTVK